MRVVGSLQASWWRDQMANLYWCFWSYPSMRNLVRVTAKAEAVLCSMPVRYQLQ